MFAEYRARGLGVNKAAQPEVPDEALKGALLECLDAREGVGLVVRIFECFSAENLHETQVASAEDDLRLF